MSNYAIRRSLFAAAASIALLSGPMASSSLGAAIVVKEKDSCGLGPWEIPGLPGFTLADSAVVFLPEAAGFFVVTCHGALPAGLSLGETFQGDVTCFGDDGTAAVGHVVATRSGRVSLQCRIPY